MQPEEQWSYWIQFWSKFTNGKQKELVVLHFDCTQVYISYLVIKFGWAQRFWVGSIYFSAALIISWCKRRNYGETVKHTESQFLLKKKIVPDNYQSDAGCGFALSHYCWLSKHKCKARVFLSYPSLTSCNPQVLMTSKSIINGKEQ